MTFCCDAVTFCRPLMTTSLNSSCVMRFSDSTRFGA